MHLLGPKVDQLFLWIGHCDWSLIQISIVNLRRRSELRQGSRQDSVLDRPKISHGRRPNGDSPMRRGKSLSARPDSDEGKGEVRSDPEHAFAGHNRLPT